jgi:hypothetical protein
MRLFLIASSVALGAAFTSPASASDGWAALHRPLRLAPLAAGASCPVTKSHRLGHEPLRGLGTGPAYPMVPARFSSDDRHAGWIAAKTLWSWAPRLLKQHTFVLVRGKRLDQPGAMRFQLGPNWDTALRDELRIDTAEPVGSYSDTAWGATVTSLAVRGPGCYGLQLDSARGTSTIVLAV